MVGEVSFQAVEKFVLTPFSERGSDFFVNLAIEGAVGLAVKHRAGEAVEGRVRRQEGAPAVDLVQADGQRGADRGPRVEVGQFVGIDHVIGRWDVGFFLGEVELRGDFRDAQGVDEEEQAARLTEDGAAFLPEQFVFHFPVFAREVEEGDERAGGFAAVAFEFIDEGLQDSAVDLETQGGRVPAASDAFAKSADGLVVGAVGDVAVLGVVAGADLVVEGFETQALGVVLRLADFLEQDSEEGRFADGLRAEDGDGAGFAVFEGARGQLAMAVGAEAAIGGLAAHGAVEGAGEQEDIGQAADPPAFVSAGVDPPGAFEGGARAVRESGAAEGAGEDGVVDLAREVREAGVAGALQVHLVGGEVAEAEGTAQASEGVKPG